MRSWRSNYLPLLLGLLGGYPGGAGAQSGFTDQTARAGLTEVGQARGVSVCDYNADGRPDVYVAFRDRANVLYRNDGDFRFTEVAAAVGLADAGASSFSLWADFDNDGRREVFVGNRQEPARLYRPLGSGEDVTYVPVSGSRVPARSDYLMSGAVLDYNRDGLLDLYLACLGCPNRLLRNDGDLHFTEVGGAAGAAQGGLAMGTLAFDYDGDGWTDLYCIHDGPQPNVLYRNFGGYFLDVSAQTGTGVVGDGMGVTVHDYDLDGDPDIYVTNLFENFLLRNAGDGTFAEVGFDSRTNDLGMGWGTGWLDFDNDGLPDLFVANETNFTVAGRSYPNLLYRNRGDGTFASVTPAGDPLASAGSGFGAAVADFDGDGRPDLVVANSLNAPTEIFRNEYPGAGNWLSVELTGAAGNRDGYGSRVTVHTDRGDLTRELTAGGSFASQHEGRLHFGLGDRRVDSISVHWPGGERRRYPARVNAVNEISEAGPLSLRQLPPTSGTLRAAPNPTPGAVQLSATDGRPLPARMTLLATDGRRLASLPLRAGRLDLPAALPPGVYELVDYAAGRRVRVVLRN